MKGVEFLDDVVELRVSQQVVCLDSILVTGSALLHGALRDHRLRMTPEDDDTPGI